MIQGFTPLVRFLLLLLLVGFAMAGLGLWSSVHVALSNASVFVTYNADNNMTDSELSMDLVDLDKNITVLTRHLPFNQSEGFLEFDCTNFLHAGNFSFRLDQMGHKGALKSTSSWWSPVLRSQWPTFHFGVERVNNYSSGAFQVSVSTNVDFHVCLNSSSSLYLEVSYMEHNQIGKNIIDKVQKRTTHNIQVVKSQHMELKCASLLTEAGFIQVALKSHYTKQDIKSSGPLYLSRIYSYKLLVDNVYKTGCEGTVSVRLLSPPCTVTTGKVLLYKEASAAAEQQKHSQLAFHFLTQGENETEFNCSQFDLGQKKYCFHYERIYSQSSSLAHTCIIVQRNAVEMWGPWQTWSGCSVTCGEGVRERVRECLVPPGGGMQCNGMVREQSLCSLEDCTDILPPVSAPPPPSVDSFLGGNLVVVTGISLCLAVILITIVITVWRKLCHAPKFFSAKPETMHSPGGRKHSDEASICGHSVRRPSFSESMGASAFQKGQTCPVSIRAASDKGVLACQQSFPLPVTSPQNPERLSPSGQKILPPVFGYRLAQQQLKEMKKKGLKEATQVYHVSQSPVDDIMVEATASTSAGLTPVPQDLESQEEVTIRHIRKSPFTEPTWHHRNSATLPDRLSPKVDLILTTPKSFSDRDRRQERTADWVAMVERNRFSFSNNPNFRRTSSFNESNLQHLPKPQPFRERSMTQVASRQIPEGSCRIRAWEHPIPELEDWSQSKYRIPDSSSHQRQRPLVDIPSFTKCKPAVVQSGTVPTKNRVTDSHGVGWVPSFGIERVERAEQNWNRRGPSPIQRNILARKLREASSSANYQRKRSSTFSSYDQSRGRCRSLPLSADYSSSSYGLTEDEQQMMDISGYLGEEDGTGITKDLRLT
ncbi:thrombospondin type-1 domain-containing protein 1 isoform X1 [Tachysurus vachellii]|uniref:thrombospondin type-1 domain-containing protein 1 isoform X1 n=1 Tax=Tachysurus vachellii TaxID=175792 RepID=UPI00296AB1FB|nr:thrombospondin type-1 domain-containing protein 1 isoform X1 [Tachysurus vachellii]XP_060751894.1 thrombospondin type-1 domain-containing protein 1 isoform X1 [Tachysurus vachellii]